MKRRVILALGFSILGMGAACARPAPSPPTPTGIPSMTPTEIPGPSALECSSFAASGGLPIGIPFPLPFPGAEVQGSPSPPSPLAQQLDETLRRAFREIGLANPQQTCFFDVRSKNRIGVLAVYKFSSELSRDMANRLQETLQQQGIEASSTLPIEMTKEMVLLELRYPDGAEGSLMSVGTKAWGWILPSR
ncbi:MAG: hypothetical protein RMK32_05365 [Anaerolineae bacterium]|nr:hypothetical protein [Anaerolineae bacterium]